MGEENNWISGSTIVCKSEVVFEVYWGDVFQSGIFEEGGLVRATIILTSVGKNIVFYRGRISVCVFYKIWWLVRRWSEYY